MDKKVVIYTFETCPYCIRAKRLLTNKNIDFTEINITNQDDKLKELEKKTGVDTVPQVFVDDKFIGGCDDLIELHKQGKFDEIFK